MSYAHKYFPRLQTHQDEILQRLETLVNIDSGTGQVEGVNQIVLYLRQWLAELGFTVTLHEEEDFGYNLVARRAGGGKTRLLLVGHIDTVYRPGTALSHPFTVRDGLAFGPGIIDMKSGVVMCISVLQALLEAGFEQYGELCVVFNNDEEVGSPGSSLLIQEIARHIDIGLVLEPSRAADVITKARKGSDKYVLEVFGVPAHSGAEPHKGRSAVIELAHKMLAIHNLNTLFHGVTYNVTRISSSEPLNVVPDVARCHISVRAHDVHSLDLAAQTMQRIVAGSSIPDTRSVLTRKRGRKPYRATPEVIQLVTMAQAEAEAFGLEIIAEGKGGVSDANTLMEVGVPTLDSLGPVGGGMHDLNREFLRVDSLPLRGAILAGLIERICLSKFTGTEPYS
jgi:glutamate carboxypeptidase